MSSFASLAPRWHGRPVLLMPLLLLLCADVVSAEEMWLEAELPCRITLEAPSGNNKRRRQVVAATIEWQKLFAENNVSGKVSPPSFKLYERKGDDAKPTPCDYMDGMVVWQLSGITKPLTTRTYVLYFTMAEEEPKAVIGNVLKPGEKPPGVNLVENGDFEAGSDKWEVEEPFEAGKEIIVAPGEGVEGSVGLRLKTKLVGKRHRAGCASRFFPVKPGTKYFGGTKIRMLRSEKGSDGSGCATMSLQFYKADKSRNWRQRMMAGARFVSGQWDDVSKKIGMIAPGDTPWARVHLSAGWYGPAEAIFDEVRVVEMPKGGVIEIKVGKLEKKP